MAVWVSLDGSGHECCDDDGGHGPLAEMKVDNRSQLCNHATKLATEHHK